MIREDKEELFDRSKELPAFDVKIDSRISRHTKADLRGLLPGERFGKPLFRTPAEVQTVGPQSEHMKDLSRFLQTESATRQRLIESVSNNMKQIQ